MRKFLSAIKPITFVLAQLIAFPRRMRVLHFLNTNLYWSSFGYKNTAGFPYFYRDKDFGIKGWLLFPLYCFAWIFHLIIQIAYWIFLLFGPAFWLAPVFGTYIFFFAIGWIYFLAEIDKLVSLNILGEIDWDLLYKRNK